MSPKNKAFVFAGALLLVSTVLVGTAVASTNSALQPFIRGEAFAGERSLTRGHHAALAVRVGQEKDGELKAVPNALVRLSSASSDSVEKRTDARGAAVFELKPGSYVVEVSIGAANASHEFVLAKSMLLGVAFDAEGVAHWRSVDHGQVERRGEISKLLVRVGEVRGGRPAPIANATVQVYRVAKDNATTTLVAEGKTGPRGFADFALPRGGYMIKIQANGVSGDHRLWLKGDQAVGALVTGDHIEWRVGGHDGKDVRGGPWSGKPNR
jgi:hypothetical protein